MLSDKETTREFVIDSVSGALAKPRQWLLSKLKEAGYDENDVFAIHLALEEAFYNAIRHGNKLEPGKKVHISYVVAPERVEISMTDNGCGFDPNSVPDCRVGENLYKTEGRGILLMRSYMDKVEFNKPGNSVHMVRYRNTKKRPVSKPGT